MHLNDFLQGFKVPAKLYWDTSFEKVLETQRALTDLHTQNWLHYSFMKWVWWLLLLCTIIPLIIWWKFTNRQRFLEICFFGVMISISSGILDSIGVALLLWTYPYGLVPALPNFFPIDYVGLPVIFMLIYQKYPGWKAFVIASTLVSSFLSVVLDPIMVYINAYQPLSWQYYYSIPVFLFMVCFCKWVTTIITGQDARYKGDASGKKAA